jgi:hypothetical protein
MQAAVVLSRFVQLSSLSAAPSALPSVREQLFTETVVRSASPSMSESSSSNRRTISKARCSASLER